MSATYDVVIVGGGIAGLSLASALAGQMQRCPGGSRADPGLPHLGPLGAAADPQLRPSRGPGAHRPDAGTHRRPGRRPVRNRCSRPRSFMLIGDDATVRAEASGHMRTDQPRRGTGAVPGPGPGLVHRRRPGHWLLRLQRPRAARGPPAACRGRRRGHHHRRQGPFGPAPRLRLGTRRRAGRFPGRRRGQCRRCLGRRTRRPQRRRKGPAAAVPAHRGDCRRRTSPPGGLPDGGRGRRQLLLPPGRRPGPDLTLGDTCPSGPEDARPYPGDVERLIARLNAITTLGIRGISKAWTGLRTEAADGVPVVGFDAEAPGFFWLAGQGGYGFQTSSGIAELAAGLILAGQGPAAGCPPPGPASRTAEALAATRWSIRR